MEENQLTVTGTGAASQAPDALRINVGVEARRKSVRAAYTAAAEALTAVDGVLAARSVAKHLTATGAFTVRADSSWKEGLGTVTTGYVVASSLSVQLPWLDDARDILAAVVDAAGDDGRINGMEPVVTDPAAAAETARSLAWEDALAKAQHFARMAGRGLGPVLTISEPSGPVPLDPGFTRVLAATSVPLEPGRTSIQAAVTVCWRLL